MTTIALFRLSRRAINVGFIGRIARSAKVAVVWWNAAFLAFLFSACAVPQVAFGWLLFVAAVANLFAASKHRLRIERRGGVR